MTMYQATFDWVEYPEGRARFAGGVRGADELGHDTFAVELHGRTYYGEIRRTFLENGNDFNIEIVSFGWPGKEWMGMPMPGMCQVFVAKDLEIARALIVRLVKSGFELNDRPNFLLEYPDARFMGKVVFRDTWAVLNEAGAPL